MTTRGRPETVDAKRRRSMVGMRLCEADKSSLAASAKANGRSLSAEAEHRIVRSFRDDEILSELRALRDDVRAGRLSISEATGGR